MIIFHFKREDRHVECRHIHIIIVRKEASMTIILYVCTRISAAMKLLLLGIRSKVHSGYEINIWQDPWIPSTPTRSVRPRAPVVNPKMIVSSLINFESKEWDARLLAQYVDKEDISMIQSLAISPTHRRDTFCWSYTINDQYTVKSGYWVATNIMTADEEK